jgi:hypothetical protein
MTSMCAWPYTLTVLNERLQVGHGPSGDHRIEDITVPVNLRLLIWQRRDAVELRRHRACLGRWVRQASNF